MAYVPSQPFMWLPCLFGMKGWSLYPFPQKWLSLTDICCVRPKSAFSERKRVQQSVCCQEGQIMQRFFFAGVDIAKNSSRRQFEGIDSVEPPTQPQLPGQQLNSLYNSGGLEDPSADILPMASSGPGYTSSGLTNFQPPSDPGGRRQSNISEGAVPLLDSLSGMSTERGRTTQRGGGHKSRGPQQDSGFTNISSNIMNDRFDHYNKPSSRATSRDRSVDRFASRGTTPVPPELVNPRSRAPSAQRHTAPDCTPDSGVFEDDGMTSTQQERPSRRPSRPTSVLPNEVGGLAPLTGNGSVGGSFPVPYHIPSNQKEAENLLRQRACGQFIPQPATPMGGGGGTFKRTESLYINPVNRQQQQQQTMKVGLPSPVVLIITTFCFARQFMFIAVKDILWPFGLVSFAAGSSRQCPQAQEVSTWRQALARQHAHHVQGTGLCAQLCPEGDLQEAAWGGRALQGEPVTVPHLSNTAGKELGGQVL